MCFESYFCLWHRFGLHSKCNKAVSHTFALLWTCISSSNCFSNRFKLSDQVSLWLVTLQHCSFTDPTAQMPAQHFVLSPRHCENECHEWPTYEFDPCDQFGGGLKELPKDEVALLYLRSNPIQNLNTSLVCKSNMEAMERLRQWSWICNVQQATRAAVFLDVGNVLSDLTHPQLRNLQRHLTGPGMEGVDVYVCTRGEHRWIELLEDNKLNAFCSSVKGVMVTRYLERHAHRHPQLHVSRPPITPLHFLFFENGDKGDCAELLNVPVLLFDDKVTNLRQVFHKGCKGSHGLLIETRKNWAAEWHWRTNTYELETNKWPEYVLDWLANLPGNSGKSSSATSSGATGQ